MIQKSLIPYIKQQLKNGYSIEAIRAAILNQGYSHFDTEDSINHATGKVLISAPAQVQPPKKLGFFQKMETVMFHPKEFFDAIKPEGLWPSLFYLLIIFILSTLIFSALMIAVEIQLKWGSTLIVISTIFLTILIIIAYLWYVINALFGAFLAYLISRLLKGTATYADMVKVTIYTTTPVWLVIIIIGLVIIPAVIFLPDFINIQNLLLNPRDILAKLLTLGLALIFFSIVSLLATFWSLALYVKGLGLVNAKSAWWAIGVLILQLIIASLISYAISWALSFFLSDAIISQVLANLPAPQTPPNP
ncbi:MAG: hypothetical protein A2Y06_03375 [Omnitrophica WOR_2 bacterium GWA2_37_7]|nr:MAG: hypothetical protein A2Y06_03375 [Omnitrophica WOR_2 bacterium GWA2_37_7]